MRIQKNSTIDTSMLKIWINGNELSKEEVHNTEYEITHYWGQEPSQLTITTQGVDYPPGYRDWVAIQILEDEPLIFTTRNITIDLDKISRIATIEKIIDRNSYWGMIRDKIWKGGDNMGGGHEEEKKDIDNHGKTYKRFTLRNIMDNVDMNNVCERRHLEQAIEIIIRQLHLDFDSEINLNDSKIQTYFNEYPDAIDWLIKKDFLVPKSFIGFAFPISSEIEYKVIRKALKAMFTSWPPDPSLITGQEIEIARAEFDALGQFKDMAVNKHERR